MNSFFLNGIYAQYRVSSEDHSAKTSPREETYKLLVANNDKAEIIEAPQYHIHSGSGLKEAPGRNKELLTAHITQEDKLVPDLKQSFDQNKTYFKCEAKQLCPVGKKESGVTKRYAYFMKRKSDGVVIPTFLQCHPEGDFSILTAQELIPVLNEENLNSSECITKENLQNHISGQFVNNTLSALRSYKGKCPQDNNFGKSLYKNIEKDIKNAFNIFSIHKQEKVKAGCLTNAITNAIQSIYQTVKMFIWDAPRKAIDIAKSVFSFAFDKEEENSTAMLLSSIMPKDMAQALANWDIPGFIAKVKSNLFGLLADIKEFYRDIIGCTEWSGIPYSSQCLKKTDWECPTWDNIINMVCGLGSQLLSGYFLGGLLGTGKSILNMAKLKRSIAHNPDKVGLGQKTKDLLTSNQFVNEQLARTKDLKDTMAYKTRRKARAVTDFVNFHKDSVDYFLKFGENFRDMIKSTPVVSSYHYAFQKGQEKAWKKSNDLQMRSKSTNDLERDRKRALRFDNVQSKFDELLEDFKEAIAKNSDASPAQIRKYIKDFEKDYFAEVKKELEFLGMNVDIVKGRGKSKNRDMLKILKKGEDGKKDEFIIYDPKIDSRAQSIIKEDKLSDDGIKDKMTNGDILLGDRSSASLSSNTPQFWKDFIDSADNHKGTFTLKSNGVDGFVYFGHFSAQNKAIEKVEDCNKKLVDSEVLRFQEITNLDSSGKKMPDNSNHPLHSTE